ncbi:MAG: hypothetical protein QG673_458 [Pseudomonadota bacterium]|nr:hypothetical protein [Pseudomonadota bacterium]
MINARKINPHPHLHIYKDAKTDSNTKLEAMKNIMPFWDQISSENRHDILKCIDTFISGNDSRLFPDKIQQDSHLNELDLAIQTAINTLPTNTKFNKDVVLKGLCSIIKNDRIAKAKVTDSLNGLLFITELNDKKSPNASNNKHQHLFINTNSTPADKFVTEKLSKAENNNAKQHIEFLAASNFVQIKRDFHDFITNYEFNPDHINSLKALFKNITNPKNVDNLQGWGSSTRENVRLALMFMKEGKFGDNPKVLKSFTKHIISFAVDNIHSYANAAPSYQYGGKVITAMANLILETIDSKQQLFINDDELFELLTNAISESFPDKIKAMATMRPDKPTQPIANTNMGEKQQATTLNDTNFNSDEPGYELVTLPSSSKST